MKNILWETFEIAVNFYQAFMIIYFAFSYLGDKKNRNLLKSSGLAYIIALAAIISLMNYLTVFEHFYSLTYIVIVFVYTINNLNGSLLKKMFATIFPNLIMATVSVLTANLFSVFLIRILLLKLQNQTTNHMDLALRLYVILRKNTMDNVIFMRKEITFAAMLHFRENK